MYEKGKRHRKEGICQFRRRSGHCADTCLSFLRSKKLWPFKDFDVRAFFLKTFPGIINLTSDEMLCWIVSKVPRRFWMEESADELFMFKFVIHQSTYWKCERSALFSTTNQFSRNWLKAAAALFKNTFIIPLYSFDFRMTWKVFTENISPLLCLKYLN